MQLSRLRLEHYNLMLLHLEPVVEAEPVALGSYADFENADFTSSVQFGSANLPNDAAHFTVSLQLEAGPHKGKADFPYKLKIHLLGVFDGGSLAEERREPLVAVNGASMLYGIAREMILGLTHRCVAGPVMLPTVEFSQLGHKMEQDRKVEPKLAGSSKKAKRLPAPPEQDPKLR